MQDLSLPHGPLPRYYCTELLSQLVALTPWPPTTVLELHAAEPSPILQRLETARHGPRVDAFLFKPLFGLAQANRRACLRVDADSVLKSTPPLAKKKTSGW